MYNTILLQDIQVNTKDKQALKEIIAQEISTLEAEIAVLGTQLKPVDKECLPENVSHQDRYQQQNIIFHRYDTARKRLNKLNYTLKIIDQPDYGICQECEEDIPLARLKLAPESRYCVGCMEELGL